MPKITFIQHDGDRHEIEANNGDSLMKAATFNGLPGIDADCGGACACATCQIYIADDWVSRIGERSEEEESMLELSFNMRPTSRLACQITVTPEMDGLVVYVPEEQG